MNRKIFIVNSANTPGLYAQFDEGVCRNCCHSVGQGNVQLSEKDERPNEHRESCCLSGNRIYLRGSFFVRGVRD